MSILSRRKVLDLFLQSWNKFASEGKGEAERSVFHGPAKGRETRERSFFDPQNLRARIHRAQRIPLAVEHGQHDTG